VELNTRPRTMRLIAHSQSFPGIFARSNVCAATQIKLRGTTRDEVFSYFADL
jgi:hypothetical protein